MNVTVTFVLSGTHYELDRTTAERRLVGVQPEAIRKHAVSIDDTWFPVVQAFETATGISRSEFKSGIARRQLFALGFEMKKIEVANNGADAVTFRQLTTRPHRHSDESWHTEANIQAVVVTWLVQHGWSIQSVANTATKEHGIDIIAERGKDRVGIEVKGFPSRNYADPARVHERKRTSPSTQAGHWYGQAILAALRLREKRPDMVSVIALPDLIRYRSLLAETEVPLRAAGVTVMLVDQTRNVVEVGPFSAIA